MAETLTAKWTLLTSSERLNRSSQSLAVVGTQVLIFGGEVVPRLPVDNQLDVIDLSGEVISAVTIPAQDDAKAPTPRVGATTTAINDRLYMFSGRGGLAMEPIEEHGALWAYSTSSSTWELIALRDPSAPYPEGRSYHCMTSDGQSTIFIHAGCPATGRLSDLWAFNLEQREWTQLPDGLSGARGGASIAYHSGILYRMHGFDGKKELGGAIDAFDIKTNSWTTTAHFIPDGVKAPGARSVAVLCAMEGYLITMFGETDPSTLGHAGAGKMLGDAWAYSIQKKQWFKVEWEGEGPKPRGWFAADVVKLVQVGGKSSIVVHGGLAEDNSRLGDVWRFELV
ncbi:kelch repeat protein [Lentinula raphanica]|nr:kelch repeat protein [Lentinula raphanica]